MINKLILKKTTFLFALALFFVPIFKANATTTNWTGNTSTAWSNLANWDNGVPTSAADVVINPANYTGSAVNPILDATNLVCNTLTINGAGTLTGASATDLTTSGDISGTGTLNANASTITITGNLTVSTFASGTSTIIFSNGTNIILGSSINNFHNLDLDNHAVSLGATTTIGGTLVTTDGNGNANLKLAGFNLSVTGNVSLNGNTGNAITTLGNTLTLTGSILGIGRLDLTGNGQLLIAGNFNVGSFLCGVGTGKVTFNGTNQTTNGYAFENLDIHNASTAVTMLNSIEVDGNLSGAGSLAQGNFQVALVGDMTLTTFIPGSSSTSVFYLSSSGIATTAIQHLNGPHTFYNLKNEDTKTILTGGPITITNNIDFEAGNIEIGTNNLILTGASQTWGGSAPIVKALGFIVTASTGYVTQSISTVSTTFPVGPTSTIFAPLTLTTTSVSTTANVNVLQGVTNEHAHALVFSNDSFVNLTWLAVPALSATVKITSQWNFTDESAHFNRTLSYISWRNTQTSVSQWTPLSAGVPASGSNPYTVTMDGTTQSGAATHTLAMTGGTNYFLAVGCKGSSALPVTLTCFNVSCEDNHVILDWNTSCEINNHYFEIERSEDCKKWQSICQIEGQGNTIVPQKYTAKDNLNDVAPTGDLYYRLKQVDFNGASEYSMIRSVSVNNTQSSIETYPNPTSNYININWTSLTNETTILNITNSSGRIVYSENVSGAGNIHKQIDMTGYPKGTYFIQTIKGNKSMFKTVCKN